VKSAQRLRVLQPKWEVEVRSNQDVAAINYANMYHNRSQLEEVMASGVDEKSNPSLGRGEESPG